MTDSYEQTIADSLEVQQQLLPPMPFLLQDLWALGSSVELIVDTVASFDLPADTTTVLDLGCGKGAVAIQLAFLRALRGLRGESKNFNHEAHEKHEDSANQTGAMNEFS